MSAPDLLKALKRDGWNEIGQAGSHVQLKHPTKVGKVTLGVHTSKTIPPRILASILNRPTSRGRTAEAVVAMEGRR
ncbi:MAG: type II toxin-antitoxin system HicA family toxin [Chloroflexi bacterium]|nr:type II toxin-antitoxin system HicA family toxin [Chloroflexota bacterium]